jgi:hypothetical protein
MRLLKLQLRAMTPEGMFGVTIPFTLGLNVLAAPNTSGKSTCMMSILYALGLEGILGPNQYPPLPDVMRSSLSWQGQELPVVESHVRLELTSTEGKPITVQRSVAGDASRQLVHVVFGPDLTHPSLDYIRRDFHVRLGGSATDPAGFHTFLAEYLGHQLPDVPSSDDKTVPLYLECLFPYYFVDQLTGWRDIKARMPTHLRIPEMAKRSAEYVLSLDVLQQAIDKVRAEQEAARIRAEWQKLFDQMKVSLSRTGTVLRGVPEFPIAIWPPTPAPQLFAAEGQQWSTLDHVVGWYKIRIQSLLTEELPRAEEVAHQVLTDFQASEAQLARLTQELESATESLIADQAHITSLRERISTLHEDLRHYEDDRKVESRHGEVRLRVAEGVCPTCHQSIAGTLLPQNQPINPMSIQENILFINDQIATFQHMLLDGRRVVEAKEQEVSGLRRSVRDLMDLVRAQRRTIMADARAPSEAAIQERLQLEHTLRRLDEVSETVNGVMEQFRALAEEWATADGSLRALAKPQLSPADLDKLKTLQESFVSQVQQYGFSSFPVSDLGISRQSYRPSRRDLDIGLTSASDTIRIIWAYLLGMLEVSRTHRTNHWGLVMFDEPRQHSADKLSFDSLLRRASSAIKYGQQVIFATSEDRTNLLRAIAACGHECSLLPFDGKMLIPV